MIDSQSLAEYSSHVIKASSDSELEQRLGLYRVFLKLYEHHRGLLDEILDLENTDSKWRSRVAARYVQGVTQGNQAHIITNLLKGKTQALYQPQSAWIFGRDRKAALSIQDKRLSRRHAAIQYIEGEGFYLIDLNSTNGSFINGEPVRQCSPLKDGDQVRLGSLAFTFYHCKIAQTVATVPPEVLEQINTLRSTIAPAEDETFTHPSGCPSPSTDWNNQTSGIPEETSMFLISSLPVADLQPNPVTPQLSTTQQAEILDRFLKR